MKILAVYGSEYGQAEAVLRRVGGMLEESGHAVSVFKGDAVPGGLVLEDFDAVLVAASIIQGKYQRYVREFVRRHLGVLAGRPTAFISVSGSSPESSPEWRAAAVKYAESFLRETGWSPRWTATFAGALRYPRYGLVTRWVMKMISARYGGPTDTSREFEFTDWEAVDRFGAEMAGALARRPLVSV
jgi:menaquinone-dependent protoporphyrinogen oxidase